MTVKKPDDARERAAKSEFVPKDSLFALIEVLLSDAGLPADQGRDQVEAIFELRRSA